MRERIRNYVALTFHATTWRVVYTFYCLGIGLFCIALVLIDVLDFDFDVPVAQSSGVTNQDVALLVAALLAPMAAWARTIDIGKDSIRVSIEGLVSTAQTAASEAALGLNLAELDLRTKGQDG